MAGQKIDTTPFQNAGDCSNSSESRHHWPISIQEVQLWLYLQSRFSTSSIIIKVFNSRGCCLLIWTWTKHVWIHFLSEYLQRQRAFFYAWFNGNILYGHCSLRKLLSSTKKIAIGPEECRQSDTRWRLHVLIMCLRLIVESCRQNKSVWIALQKYTASGWTIWVLPWVVGTWLHDKL